MKSTESIVRLAEKISRFAPTLGGVFTSANLSNLIGRGSTKSNLKVVNRLVRDGLLYRVRQGVYVTKKPDLWALTARLQPNSYISMDNILAKNLLIGTIPGTVSAVYPGIRRKNFATPFGKIRFFCTRKDIFFGTKKIKNGVQIADNEKAYIDMLYYYKKGARFVCNPFQDVKIWKLDLNKIQRYLRKYRDPKFVRFVERQWEENV